MSGEASQFSIVYDGPAFDAHEIDIYAFSESLKGLGDAITEANVILNGKAAPLDVKVKADLIAGSFGFELEIVQHLINAKDVLLHLGFTELLTGCGVSATALEVFRKLRGRSIDLVEVDSDSEQVKLVVDGEEIVCSKDVEKIVNSPVIRRAFDSVIYSPLNNDGAEIFKILKNRDEENPIIAIPKGDGNAFKLKRKPFTEKVNSENIEANVTFIAANVDAKNGWQIKYLNELIIVKMEDDAFREKLKVDKDINIFGEMFVVKMSRKSIQKGEGGPVDTKLSIKEVIRHRASSDRRII